MHMLCGWCEMDFEPKRKDAVFCHKTCRQRAWRFKQRFGPPRVGPNTIPGETFAYADPPYMGHAQDYKDQPSYAGKVDHVRLIEDLEAADLAGWALSCSRESVPYLMDLAPQGAFFAPWCKPEPVPWGTIGVAKKTEYVIICGGRPSTKRTVDYLVTKCARDGNGLIGRKPPAFCAWIFDLMGMVPGDQLIDVFPGTRAVGRAWMEANRPGSINASHVDQGRVEYGWDALRSRNRSVHDASLRHQRPLATE